MKELDPKFEKIKELMQSLDISERRLGFVMMQQLGFLSAREFLVYKSGRTHDSLYAPLLLAFEVPKYLSYGHRLLEYHRFERVQKEKRCPVRTKPILTYGKYDSNFLLSIFANMEYYGQDVTVANEKGWLLWRGSNETDWNYKLTPGSPSRPLSEKVAWK